MSPNIPATQFLYDGDQLVAEYNDSGVLKRRYIHGDSDDDPLYGFEGAGLDQPRFPHANHQGSVIAVAGPGAALLAINTYDEYGFPGLAQRAATALATHGRFQYTGQAWLPELGMYYYKARIYSPGLGRFLQVDPIGYDDQINLYAYVANDPVNNQDPSGEACERNGGGLCGFVRDFFVGDIEDAVANPSPKTIVVAVATTIFKPAKIADKLLDAAGTAKKVQRAGETAERAANRAASRSKGIPDSRVGPSGKPKIHVRDHATRKRAEDAARSRTASGQSPMKHSNPKRGGPHFHATDAAGKKKPDGVHDNYPGRRSQ